MLHFLGGSNTIDGSPKPHATFLVLRCLFAALPWVLGTPGANACQGSRGPTDAECNQAIDVVLKALGRTPGRGVQRGSGSGVYRPLATRTRTHTACTYTHTIALPPDCAQTARSHHGRIHRPYLSTPATALVKTRRQRRKAAGGIGAGAIKHGAKSLLAAPSRAEETGQVITMAVRACPAGTLTPQSAWEVRFPGYSYSIRRNVSHVVLGVLWACSVGA
jgi:hypothetical protein